MLKIAIAGRDEAKMIAFKERYNLSNLDIIVADLDDQKSLESMTGSTQVLMSTAGPFARIGLPVVDACVSTGTNYVDITGEPQFVRRVIDKHHDTAVSKGIKIVPCCGFDCIPADFGCQMMVDDMKAKGLEPSEVVYFHYVCILPPVTSVVLYQSRR